MEKIIYKITDKNGIHARPAGLIVQVAKKYKAAVSLSLGTREADCKKLFQLMQLGVKEGDEITIIANGEDETEAISEIQRTLCEAGL